MKYIYYLTLLIASIIVLGSCSKDNSKIPHVVRVELDHLPTKIDYYVGEEFDVSGLMLKVTYSDNLSKIVPVKKEQIIGFNNRIPNDNLLLEIKESGFTLFFSIKMIDNSAQSIQIKKQPFKTVYTLGEPLLLEGMVLVVVYPNGKIEDITSVDVNMVKGFDSFKPTLKQLLIINKDGAEVSFEVTVLPFKVVNNEIVSSVSSDVTSFTIPEGITAINATAFFENATIEYLVCPTSLKSIGDNAFNLCVNLKKIDLSKTSISVLSSGVFERSGLIAISLPSTLKRVEGQAFSNTKSLQELILPQGLQEIGTSAFTGSGLQRITIPNTVCYIERAFYNCEQLKTIRTVGSEKSTDFDKVALIQAECFNKSPNIEILEIPESITRIGTSVLGACKVKTLILPESVKVLGHNAFGNASSLEEITLKSATKVEASLYPVPITIKTIKVPMQLVDQYKSDECWKSFAAKIVAL